MCDKGAAHRVGRCRDEVVSALGPGVHEQFLHCLRAGQEPPDVHQAKDLPSFSQWLTPEDRDVKGWYVSLCDPTLPEAHFDDQTASAAPDRTPVVDMAYIVQ